MSQLIRAVEELDVMILKSLFGDRYEIKFDETLGSFAQKGRPINQDDIDNALNCKINGGDSYSLEKHRCEYPSREE